MSGHAQKPNFRQLQATNIHYAKDIDIFCILSDQHNYSADLRKVQISQSTPDCHIAVSECEVREHFITLSLSYGDVIDIPSSMT